MAVDFEDAVARADPRGNGGTVGQRAEHYELLCLGVEGLIDADADELLFEIVIEGRLVGRLDVERRLVECVLSLADVLVGGHAAHGVLEELQLVDRAVVLLRHAVEIVGQHPAVAASRRGDIAQRGQCREGDQPAEVAKRHRRES